MPEKHAEHKHADKYSIDSHKIHYHPQRVADWLAGKDVYPIYVEVSPVGQCNHRCTFCAVDYIGYQNRKIETQVLKDTISDMAGCGVKSVMFAGEGEPTLHPDLAEIIVHTKKSGIDVGITTNGTGLSERFRNICLPYVSWIKVSINGGRNNYPLIHRTTAKDYARIWDNLRLLSEHKHECGYNAVVGVQSLLLDENMEDMEELASLSRGYHLDYLVIKPYSQHKKSFTTKYKDIRYGQDYDLFFDNLKKKYENDSFKIIARTNSMASWDSPERGYTKCCSTPYFWAYIMATGDVYGCSAYLQDDRFCYGNVNTNSFKAIWQGEKRKASRDYVEQHLDISECRKNCRMDKVNQYLFDLKEGVEHKNFI